MRFSTVVAGLVFGLGAAAIRAGPVQAGQVAAEVRTDSCDVCGAMSPLPRSLVMLIAIFSLAMNWVQLLRLVRQLLGTVMNLQNCRFDTKGLVGASTNATTNST